MIGIRRKMAKNSRKKIVEESANKMKNNTKRIKNQHKKGQKRKSKNELKNEEKNTKGKEEKIEIIMKSKGRFFFYPWNVRQKAHLCKCKNNIQHSSP